MKTIKLAASALILTLAVAVGSSASAGSAVIGLSLGAECGDGLASMTVTVASQVMESQEIELQVWVAGTQAYLFDYTLSGAESHDFPLPAMALDNVVKFIVLSDGIVEKETDWLELDESCMFQDSMRLLFVASDSACVAGHYEYTFTLYNEYSSEMTFDMLSEVNGVVVEQQFVIPSGGSDVSDPVVIPTGVALVVVIDFYLGMTEEPYMQNGFTSSTGYPVCDDGDDDSGAGLPDSGADSGTLALLAGGLLALGVGLAGATRMHRRSA